MSVTPVSSLLIGSVELESPAIGCGRNKCCLMICDGGRVGGSDRTGAIAFCMWLKRKIKLLDFILRMNERKNLLFFFNDHYLTQDSSREWVSVGGRSRGRRDVMQFIATLVIWVSTRWIMYWLIRLEFTVIC